MAKPHERVFALIGALLFLLTTVGLTAVVLVQMREEKKQSDLQNALIQAQKKTPEASNTNQKQEGKLQGTKLEGFTPVASVSELQITDIKEGTGEAVKPGDTITAHYTGALAQDGTIFESSKDSGQPATFPLSGVIAGWQQGVPGMKVGGIRRLVIPANLAYGERGSPPKIGPNATLVFDIELVKIGQ